MIEGEEEKRAVADAVKSFIEDEELILIKVDPIFQFFAYAHLRVDLQQYSKPFHDLARHIITTFPRNAERTVALRKLLEAKDAAIRCMIMRTKD